MDRNSVTPGRTGNDRDRPACRRRELLAGVGGTAVAATLPAGAVSPAARTPATAVAGGTVQTSSEEPVTLEGTVSCQPVSAGDRLLVGTSRGVYLFADESLAAFVPTQPVRSLHAISEDLVVALLRDRFFENIVGIDPATGSVRWSAGRSVSVYSQELGEVDRQTQAYDAASIGDVTGTGTADAVIAAGYGVFALDGETGETIWAADLDRYAWRVAVADGTVYAGTQRGDLLALAAEDGTERFRTQVADPYETANGSVTRSVWDVAVADGVVVTTEEGFVKQVDPSDGTVEWETRLLDLGDERLSEYYDQIDGRPSMPGSQRRDADPNFFNLALTPAGDRGFAVDVFEWVPGAEDQTRLVFLDSSGQEQWSDESINRFGERTLLFDPDIDTERLLTISGNDDAGQVVSRLALADGSDSPLEVPTVSSASRRGGPGEEGFLAGIDGTLAVVSPNSDLRVVDDEGAIQWGFPTIRERTVLSGDFLDTDATDYLIASRERLDFQRGIESRTLLVRSGEDGSVGWSRTRPPDRFRAEGGLRQVRVFEDTGGTHLVGIEQPVAENPDELRDLENRIRELDGRIEQAETELQQLRQEDRDQREIDRLEDRLASLRADREDRLAEIEDLGGRPTAELVARSGADGSERFRIPLAERRDGLDRLFEPTSLDVAEFDGTPTAAVGTTDVLLFADLERGEIVDGLPIGEIEGFPPFDSRRLDYRVLGFESGGIELLVIDGREARAAVVEVAVSERSVEVDQRARIDLPGEEVSGSPTVLGDLTGDGYEELLFTTRGGDGLTVSLVAPGSGEILRNASSEQGIVPTITAAERPDGGTDAVVFSLSGEEFTAEVTDGTETVWRHDREFSPFGFVGSETEYRPATPVPGIDGDESVGFALAVAGPEGGARVELYTAENELTGTIPLEQFRSDVDPDDDAVIPALRVETVPSAGGPKLGVVVGSPRAERSRFYLVDPVAEEKLARTTSVEPTAVGLAAGVGVLGRDGSLTRVDPSGGVSLADPSADSTQRLEWRFQTDTEYVTTVRVNQQPVTITTDQSAELRLPDGDHRIEVGARDRTGLTVYDTAVASVSGGSLADLVLYAVSGLSVLLLFAFGGIERLRRRVA